MKKVWEKFVDDYDDLDKYPLIIVLEAFWQYSYTFMKGTNDKYCDLVFKRYNKERDEPLK